MPSHDPRQDLLDGSEATSVDGTSGVVHGSSAALAGALGGAFVALGDYGAMWLWLPDWGDRWALLIKQLGCLAPAGAALAALARWAPVAGRRAVPGGDAAGWAWPWPWVVLALPGTYWLANALCAGGGVSRLPFVDLLRTALVVSLPLGLWAGLLGARYLAQSPGPRWRAWTLLATAAGLGKVNQLVLPNLYDYLHGLLALLTWALAALGASCALRSWRPLRRLLAAPRRWRWAAGAALAAVGAVTFAGLEANLNVRVAMFDARCPSSRYLLMASEHALRHLSGRAGRVTHARARAAPRFDPRGLPQLPGAHILLVTVDALRADHLGCYGYQRPTSPGLDTLAADAVRFEHAYAQAPHSSYSISSLMTSEYIHEVVDLPRPLPTATLATALAASGYHTAGFFTDGIFHTEGTRLTPYRDRAFGFALYDHTNRDAEATTDRVLAEIERIRGQGEPPSLLWAHYFDVHEPYVADELGRSDRDRYDSEIARVDRAVLRLVTQARERLERDVIVALTADHGEEFREHGGVYHGSTLYEEQVRVPLIVQASGLGRATPSAPVELIDLAPTLLGLVGVAPPPSMRGRDLRGRALGLDASSPPVFSAVLHKRMVVRWPHKLIADLRFNLYELYDLQRDPHERHNLANDEPALLRELREHVYGWLDRLGDPASAAPETRARWEQALHWGRLGDRRAVQAMSALVLDRTAPTTARVEAAQILARLADPKSADALVRALHTEPTIVAAEAAVALGRMYDNRARAALRRLMYAEDPMLRARAAVSLGRLRDRAAVPALIDALWVAPSQYEREEAVRWLGRLRDRRALEPLLSIIPEFRLRYLVTVALGQLGDPRAFDALSDMLRWERHTNIRDNVARGLGQLGDPRALPLLLELAQTEPDLKNVSESLVRVGALERGAAGGLDLEASPPGASGLGTCVRGPLFHDWDYLNRTYCETQASEVRLPLRRLDAPGDGTGGVLVLLRARRSDAPEAAELRLWVGDHALAPVTIDGEWAEQRWTVSAADALGREALTARIRSAPPEARLSLDHLLLLPLPAASPPPAPPPP